MTEVELVVIANGCTDHTASYLQNLHRQFDYLGFGKHLIYEVHEAPLGYSRACNAGIQACTGDYVILLNNDTVLLDQPKNNWLNMLHSKFQEHPDCGLSGPVKIWSEHAQHEFVIFFCVMISRAVFNTIGLLNTDYGVGSGEDIEFCVEAVRNGFKLYETGEKNWSPQIGLWASTFPIYHKGEGTVHDPALVFNWAEIFENNMNKLAQKYGNQNQ
jgi:O-antigen biosynthesis protein